jgi:hypothetical protein
MANKIIDGLFWYAAAFAKINAVLLNRSPEIVAVSSAVGQQRELLQL